MQRLFSMFPSGRPGVALLIMRVALAVMILNGFIGRLEGLSSWWILAAPAALGIAICLGLLTPLVAVLTIVFEVTTWAATGGPIGTVHVCAVLNAVGLSLLGPGAYSLDARLFGRRQLILRRPDDSETE